MVKALGHNLYDVRTAPQAYDIVQVAFPYHERPYQPGPKRRPGLVLSVNVCTSEQAPEPYAVVQIAYGTSKKQDGHPWDIFHVHNYMALQRSGLCMDTWFVLSRMQRLLWCSEYFPMNKQTGTPIMGRLPQEHILTLNKIKEIRDALHMNAPKSGEN